jgi:N-acetylmuramoyl-L-alanine amidase
MSPVRDQKVNNNHNSTANLRKCLGYFLSLTGLFIVLFSTRVAFAAPIKILIVPGHDDIVWGAQAGNIKEADMNLVLATKLYNILKLDKRFQVYITRNSAGYTPTLENYFESNFDDIQNFIKVYRDLNQEKITSGEITEFQAVVHNDVAADVAFRLYAINRWADENLIDAVIHVHFNDYPRSNAWEKGEYKGFAIYYPESQLPNSALSFPLAEKVFKELHKKYITSTYPKEAGGLVPDQKLIALGARSTLWPNIRSILIEYGYIYRFSNSTFRHQFYTSAANLTATGVKKYFFPK